MEGDRLRTAAARIVVGVDGSTGSRLALAHAVDAALARVLPVVAVLAYEPPATWITRTGLVPTAGALHRAAREKAQAEVDAVLAARPPTDPRPQIEVQVYSGPAPAVLERVSRGATALVVGHRGRGEVTSRLIGSVGLSCVVHAETTVVVVRG